MTGKIIFNTGQLQVFKRMKLIYNVMIIRGQGKGLPFCVTISHAAAHSESLKLCAGSSVLLHKLCLPAHCMFPHSVTIQLRHHHLGLWL